MEESWRDKNGSIDLNKFIWSKMPRFVVRTRDKFREWRLKRYKMRKVKESKLLADENYYMEFNIVIKDVNNIQCVGPFTITVPAKGAFFAKRKLKEHLVNALDIDVLHIDRSDNPHVVYHRGTENHIYDVMMYNKAGELVDKVSGVEAMTEREAYLKVEAFVRDHDLWESVKRGE